ncbi:MAG: hypothetical protein BGO26_06895 [Actinobacteria bacterium 69-20]|jgi:hypothetical protein|nr:IS4 family transposase [Actinomycetota bacterium]OJV30102.1 MAG: hypothetical protein BGO26_06895 [Actinobacteria bacterium 69-20]
MEDVETGRDEPRPGRLSDHLSLGVIARVYRRDQVDDAVTRCGRREKRERLLPARLVVYYVIALGLFFGDAYEEVMRKMVGGLKFVSAWEKAWKVPTASALCQARKRLGEAPVRELFEQVCQPLATTATIGAFAGRWRLMAIDGLVWDVPDTAANEEAFGRSPSRTGQGGAFPQVRMAALSEVGTHAVVAAEFGPLKIGERQLAEGCLFALEPGMLVCFDRGFYSFDFYGQVAATGADVLFRMSKSVKLPVLARLADDSYLSAITANRTAAPATLAVAEQMAESGRAVIVRVVEYAISDRDDADQYRVATSILDWQELISGDLADAYRHRWEIEIAFDEIETHQIGHSRVLRSKSPEMVRQEIWGILLAHYAIRALMTEAANDSDIDPDRLSFLGSLRVIRREADGSADFPPSPHR